MRSGAEGIALGRAPRVAIGRSRGSGRARGYRRPVRFGLHVPIFGPFGEPEVVVALAAEAERRGWDGFFLWDHVWFPGSPPTADPTVLLAAVAPGDPGRLVLRGRSSHRSRGGGRPSSLARPSRSTGSRAGACVSAERLRGAARLRAVR